MKRHSLTADHIAQFENRLRQEERAAGTIEKCLRDITCFWVWLDGRSVTKELVVSWKSYLMEKTTLLQQTTLGNCFSLRFSAAGGSGSGLHWLHGLNPWPSGRRPQATKLRLVMWPIKSQYFL